MDNLLLVGIGGFLGAIARYLMALGVDNVLHQRWPGFPYGTLAVNVLGSFGLALAGVWLAGRAGFSPQIRLLIGVGFFGAFTTFSTFASQSLTLLNNEGMVPFVLNLLLNNGICIICVALGLSLGQRWFASP